MSFKWYAILMGFGTGLAWIGWIIILNITNPDEAGFLGLVFFFVTLFLALVGTLSMLGLLYRIGIRKRTDMVMREVRVAFRHSILLSFIAILALWFSSQEWLRWYTVVGFLMLVVAVEYVFLVFIDAERR
ncbi:hypothetical protein GF391_02255 [Candidatus Uhrbacteria bacterium]|nr:hypothetical protein [Candidatus Uhrbacteria bacterium]